MTGIVKLTKYAINYLSKYSSSRSNLDKILKNKIRRLEIEKKEKYLLYNSIEEIIIKLEKNNLLNDKVYSESKIRNFIHQGKSRLYIKGYLIQKGISNNIILEIFEDYDLNNPNWEIESAKTFARKKRLLEKNDDKKKFSKMSRAGFSYEISKKILDKN